MSRTAPGVGTRLTCKRCWNASSPCYRRACSRCWLTGMFTTVGFGKSAGARASARKAPALPFSAPIGASARNCLNWPLSDRRAGNAEGHGSKPVALGAAYSAGDQPRRLEDDYRRIHQRRGPALPQSRSRPSGMFFA
jgi:hypothetical protein